jgi:hypothetical protein
MSAIKPSSRQPDFWRPVSPQERGLWPCCQPTATMRSCNRRKIQVRDTTASQRMHRWRATWTSWSRCGTASAFASTSTVRKRRESSRRFSLSPFTTRISRARTWPKRCRRSRPGRRSGPVRWKRETQSFSCRAGTFTLSAHRGGWGNPRAAVRGSGIATT